MDKKRKHFCDTLAEVEDRFKDRVIDQATDIASDYPKQAKSWDCSLCRPGRLYILGKEPVHVLIIEDEVILAETMEELIKTIPNVFVRVAHSADEALDAIPLGFWDAVFLDINLPDLNGLDLLAQVKDWMQDTRFYVVSGYGYEENRDRAKELGVAGFIDKPFRPEVLIDIIEDLTCSAES